MSGESGRHSRPAVGQQVRPEPVVEKTFVENVTGFINEVTPQTYSNPTHFEGKETILWVRFDYCDINDLARFRDKIEVNGNSPPLLLIVGYSCGVQAWVIPVNGEAVEVLSWRQGAVRVLKVLPTPLTSANSVDHYSLKRPIIALCDTAGPGPHFCSVSFISLKTGEQVKIIKFKHPVHDIQANKNVVVITFLEKLAVFDASTLEDTFTVTTCYPSPGPSVNPVALGDRWLAYADRRLIPLHQSFGGMVSEGTTSYKATVIHAAKSITKSLTKGIKELTESVTSNLMSQRGGSPAQQTCPSSLPTPGIVTVIDTQMVGCGELSLTTSNISGIIAHFSAHHAAPVVALGFDPTGMLLLTADKQGHSFHLFRLQPHPLSSAQSAVHHLYTLHRGDTTAKVTDISFSLDSRWVAVSTHRGTTHVFPITPYGGVIGVRTHTSSCVVNRLSRFHRSAGLDDTPSSGRNSPVLSASPSSSKFAFEVSPNMAYPNPRYPPYPTPTIVKPLAQLRQPLLQNLIGTMSTGPSPSRSPPATKSPRSPSGDDIIKVTSVFGSPRGWLAGSPTVPRDKQRRTMDSLFVMACHGNLLEYQLEPQPASGIPQDKVTEDSPIELFVHASAQWALGRESTSGELRPPLDMTSPLLAPLSPTRPRSLSPTHSFDHDDPEERWMAQVEIHTHAGPHRRLWMGPQFTFKSIPGTGNVGGQGGYEGTPIQISSSGLPPRSSPVNMPGTGGANVPVLIEAGSLTGSHDQSPRLMERYSGDSDSFDPETVMTQLRHDLADAMMDTHHSNRGRDTGGASMTSYEAASHESTLDMTDVMDISCDPPGPSPGRSASSTASSRPASHVGEEIQAVSARLYQVPVTPSGSARASPHIQRSPSLEDNRALTSSAEELSTTLGSCMKAAELPDSVWVPIEKPDMKYSKYNTDYVEIDVPAPVPAKSYSRKELPREKKLCAVNHEACSTYQQIVSCQAKASSIDGPTVPDSDNHKSLVCPENRDSVNQSFSVETSALSSKECSEGFPSSTPFSKDINSSLIFEQKNEYVDEKDDRVNEGKSSYAWRRYTAERVLPESSQCTAQEASYPPVGKQSPLKDFTEISKPRAVKGSPSTTTSEDDLWLSTEKRDQKKKKKKRSKVALQDEESPSSQVMKCSTQETLKSNENDENTFADQDVKLKDNKDSNTVDVPLDMDTDYFHAAQEYHEPSSTTKKSDQLVKEPTEAQDDFQEAQESVVQSLEDFELHGDEDDKEVPGKHSDDVMLKSLHDENDLARALEEAYSSDDNVPTQRAQIRTRSRSRPARTSEMFPFKDETSDEEEEIRLRRRLVVSATITVSGSRSANEETSTDDRGETSGDDRAESSTDDRRTGTSESDVAASPNPRASSSSKNKKKKKKKR